MYPATATGWSGIVIPATAAVPWAPSGMLRAPFPKMLLMMPPPRVDCLRISSGRAGRRDASAVNVMDDPTATAARDATMPKSGPATAMSNMAVLFGGGVLKVVTVLVTPVMRDGTNVGTDSFT